MKKELILMLFIWLILTLFNMNKAYHIDDVFHLEAAEQIKANPLKPMSGIINWDNTPQPMHRHNQPPLLFYIILLNQIVFGKSEFAMHLMISAFTFFSLFYYLKILNLFELEEKYTLLVLFGFSPAFIVNQNLMTDIPVLSIIMAINFYLIRGKINNCMRDYLYSSILLSIGLLIKYSLLPYLIVIILTALLSKQFKNLITLFVPFSILAIWCLWNYYDFGSTHMFSRPKTNFSYRLIFAYMGTLGAISIFSMLFAKQLFFKSALWAGLSLVILLISGYFIHDHFFRDFLFDHVLSTIFITNGLLVIATILVIFIRLIIKKDSKIFISPSIILLLGISGCSAFIILYAPFNATRHVLPIIPLILIFGYKHFEIPKGILSKLIITLNILLGIGLAISDWNYADFYRDQAKRIKTTNDVYWSFGHWGWQWYSRKAGMTIYSSSDRKKLKKGDFIIYPKYVAKQEYPFGVELDTIKMHIHKPSIFTYLSVHNARFYNSSVNKPSWTLSNLPYDTIFQFKIRSVDGQ